MFKDIGIRVQCQGGSKVIFKLGFVAQRFFNVGRYFQIGIFFHFSKNGFYPKMAVYVYKGISKIYKGKYVSSVFWL